MHKTINPRSIKIGTSVTVRLNSGEEKKCVLTDHSDWLVGCHVAVTEDGISIGIGYQGEIIAVAAPQQEVKNG